MKIFYNKFFECGRLVLAFQRFNRGYKNLPTKFYKNGIRIVKNSEETGIHFICGVYKLIIIWLKKNG